MIIPKINLSKIIFHNKNALVSAKLPPKLYNKMCRIQPGVEIFGKQEGVIFGLEPVQFGDEISDEFIMVTARTNKSLGKRNYTVVNLNDCLDEHPIRRLYNEIEKLSQNVNNERQRRKKFPRRSLIHAFN